MIVTLVEMVVGRPADMHQARAIVNEYYSTARHIPEDECEDAVAFLDEFERWLNSSHTGSIRLGNGPLYKIALNTEGCGDSWDDWQGNYNWMIRKFPGLRVALGVRLYESSSHFSE